MSVACKSVANRETVTQRLRDVGPLESAPGTVTDVERFHLFLFPHYAVYVRLVAVERLLEFVIFRGHVASVRLFFQTENRLLEPVIPLQRRVGVVGIDPFVNPGQIALGTGGDANEACHARLRS